MARVALTTFDNRYDPFTQFKQWFSFDEDNGYHTVSYVGRLSRTSDALSDPENDEEIERIVDEIIKYDFQNIYKKVVEKESDAKKESIRSES